MSQTTAFSGDSIRRIILLPGIGNSGPGHWQDDWESRDAACVRVQQRDWNRPICTEWAAALEDMIAGTGPDSVIAAHSLGCLVVAHWASMTSLAIRGAMLVAVPDPSGPSFPAEASGFSAVSLEQLQFPSIVVASSNDPYGEIGFARQCAAAWGSRFIDMGPAGHINATSGLGAWTEGFSLLQEL